MTADEISEVAHLMKNIGYMRVEEIADRIDTLSGIVLTDRETGEIKVGALFLDQIPDDVPISVRFRRDYIDDIEAILEHIGHVATAHLHLE